MAHGRGYNDEVRIDRGCWNNVYIDLRFTLRAYAYPHMLALILGRGGWKMKARWREHEVALPGGGAGVRGGDHQVQVEGRHAGAAGVRLSICS